MTDIKGLMRGVADEAVGMAKRAIGELTARPGLVLEGEAQQAKGNAKVRSLGADGPRSCDTIGWKLDREQRAALLELFPPKYAFTIADHVTLQAHAPAGAPAPPPCAAAIVGRVDDGEGVEALVVAIDGHAERGDGGTFHVTWSLAPTRHAAESNAVLARLGWKPLAEPIALSLHPAHF